MFRKLTAVIQLMLMLVVVATSQPSLSYCLCAHEFHVGDCPCNQEVTGGNDELLTTSEHSTCSKGCCSQQSEKTETQPSFQPQPCNDCVVNLSIDVDDYTLGSVVINKGSCDHLDTPDCANAVDLLITNNTFDTSIYGIRGSPLSSLRAQSVPLFVRHSAYLL